MRLTPRTNNISAGRALVLFLLNALHPRSPLKKVPSAMYHLFFLTTTVLGSRMYLYLFLNLKKVGGCAPRRVCLQYTVPVAQANPKISVRKRHPFVL